MIDRAKAQALLLPVMEQASRQIFGRKKDAPIAFEALCDRVLDVLTEAGLVEPEDEFLAEFERQAAMKEPRGARAKRYQIIQVLSEALLASLTSIRSSNELMPNDLASEINALTRGRRYRSGDYVLDPQRTAKDAKRFVGELGDRLDLLSRTAKHLQEYHRIREHGPDRNEILDQSLLGLAKLYAEFRNLRDPLVIPRAPGVSLIGFASVVLRPLVPGSTSREALTQRWSRVRARERGAKHLTKKQKLRAPDK